MPGAIVESNAGAVTEDAASFEVRLGTCRKVITPSTDKPVSPFGRGLKRTFAAFIATDGMYTGFAGAKTGANLVKD